MTDSQRITTEPGSGEDRADRIGPYEAFGLCIAFNLGHELASMSPTIVLAPNTQSIAKALATDLAGMVEKRAVVLHEALCLYDHSPLVGPHEAPCWKNAAAWVMDHLAQHASDGSQEVQR